MSNYLVVYLDEKYYLVERATDACYYRANNKQPVAKVAQHLNSGKGFDGFTPEFFVDKKLQREYATAVRKHG